MSVGTYPVETRKVDLGAYPRMSDDLEPVFGGDFLRFLEAQEGSRVQVVPREIDPADAINDDFFLSMIDVAGARVYEAGNGRHLGHFVISNTDVIYAGRVPGYTPVVG